MADLTVPVIIDLFADITVEFDGVSPEAEAILRNTSSDAFIKTINYKIDPVYNLKNGDQITVTANYSKNKAKEQGYAVKETQMTYIVENVDEYVTSYEQIDQDTLTKLEAQATDLVESKLADKISTQYYYPGSYDIWKLSYNSIEISDISLVNSYFLNLKDGMEKSYDDVNNCLYMVYQVSFVSNMTPEDRDQDVSYISVYFKDFILRDDQSIDVRISDGYLSKSNSIHDDLYREIVTAKKAKYNYQEIDHAASQ